MSRAREAHAGLVVGLGGLTVRFLAASRVRERLLSLLGPPTSPSRTDLTIACNVPTPPPRPGRPRGRAQRFTLAGGGWEAAVDLAARQASVTGEDPAEGVLTVLRLALPTLLREGVLVHAAVLAEHDRAALCIGPSGAGKSTLASLFPERALGDELAVVWCERGHWSVQAFPCGLHRAGASGLAALLFLRHGARDRLTPLVPTRAAGLLGQQVHWPTDDPAAMRRTFAAVTSLAKAAPSAELAFRPTRAVWRTIAETLAR